ncbi:MAG: hypothetical protein IMW90_02805 [Thermogemmatispora sp.]|uniref:hypothetical protein n=1 Tax=Thermogemmatispora sp. TaxID=1968838 RepID=UPI0019E20BEB|nr:hypothetical protein [Thermogemmatispora sp.]MBE3564638.1 hypothetical protein [Thermogemmatispora sp.]
MEITVVILVLALICLGLVVISGLQRRRRRSPAARAGVEQGSALGAEAIEAGGDQPVSGSVHSHHRHAPQPETALPSHSSGSHHSSHTGGHFGGHTGGHFGGHTGGHFGGHTGGHTSF